MMGYAGADLAIALINVILLGLLFVIGIAIARMRSLFAIVMLSGIYSLISATWFVALDAVDVAFTEAAVGAGISTALLLGAMLLTSRTAKPEAAAMRIVPLLVVIAVGAMLVYATIDLPAFGDPDSPANTYVGTDYITRAPEDIGVPNLVTAVLASYRGFDTLGEVGVVFAAALSVILLLGFGERSLSATFNRKKDEG
jgi:multicomponent Na+:H+ antiporter subunit B